MKNNDESNIISSVNQLGFKNSPIEDEFDENENKDNFFGFIFLIIIIFIIAIVIIFF